MRLTNWKGACARWAILILLLLVLTPTTVLAQETDRQDTFVYGINAGIPDAVIGTFAPPIVDTIYFLSTETSILSPRITSVYYWPITNDYRASWNRLNEVVDGELEILRGLQVIETVEQTTYTIHFRRGQGSSARPDLFIGSEAITEHESFEAQQLAYQEAVFAYEESRQLWLETARELQREGVPPEQFPPGPLRPAPINTYSTGLNEGFPVKLEEGEYRIRTRTPEGDIVPGSERRLVVFSPRRTAVGYEVIPEQRWTFPEESNDWDGAILGAPNTVVYLKPFVTREYPAIPYARLQDPQDASVAQAGEWTWVAGEPIEDAVLEHVSGSRILEHTSMQPFYVRQTPDAEFGYAILEYDSNTPELTPRVDFVGYRVPLTSDNNNFTVRLRTPDNSVMAGSDRAVRVTAGISPILLGVISLVPLLAGAGILWWRQQQTARVKSESA